MKKLIRKSIFKNLIKNDEILTIPNKLINEFRIGKNFFYEIEKNHEILTLQENLHKILKNVDLNQSSVAFRNDYSYLNLFEPHRTNYNFLRLDIKSFFHSIRIEDIKKEFEYYVEDEYINEKKKQKVIDAFINSITYIIPVESENEKFAGKQVLAMGFITSPIISNIIFRKIDIQIQKLCSQKDIIYTRYADDMLFSSKKNSNYIHSESFVKEIEIMIYQMKFLLNHKKTLKSRHTLSLNGYTIQYSEFFKEAFFTDSKILHEFRLSNKKLLIINKMIWMINKKEKYNVIYKKLFGSDFKFKYTPSKDIEIKFYKNQLLNKIVGYRSYLLSFVKFNKKYECTQQKNIEKYSLIINQLDFIIENNFYNMK